MQYPANRTTYHVGLPRPSSLVPCCPLVHTPHRSLRSSSLFKTEPPSEVLPHLYLGSAQSAAMWAQLKVPLGYWGGRDVRVPVCAAVRCSALVYVCDWTGLRAVVMCTCVSSGAPRVDCAARDGLPTLSSVCVCVFECSLGCSYRRKHLSMDAE